MYKENTTQYCSFHPPGFKQRELFEILAAKLQILVGTCPILEIYIPGHMHIDSVGVTAFTVQRREGQKIYTMQV